MWLYFRFYSYICISFKNKHIMSKTRLFWIDFDGDEIESSCTFNNITAAIDYATDCEYETEYEWFDADGELVFGTKYEYYDPETRECYSSYNVK